MVTPHCILKSIEYVIKRKAVTKVTACTVERKTGLKPATPSLEG